MFLAQGASPGKPRTARPPMLSPLAGSLRAVKPPTAFRSPITPFAVRAKFLSRHLRKRSRLFAQIGILLTVLVSIAMADRFLLLPLGLPLWRADAELHFRNRPSKFSLWPNGREIRTNR